MVATAAVNICNAPSHQKETSLIRTEFIWQKGVLIRWKLLDSQSLKSMHDMGGRGGAFVTNYRRGKSAWSCMYGAI